jgi:hypothetical protein
MSDDLDLERLMRAADPARTPADAPLTLRAEADLARITAGRESARPDIRRPWTRRWFAIPAVAFLVLMIFAVVNVLPIDGQVDRAEAGTPPILTPKGESVPTGEAMAKAIRQLGEATRASDIPRRESEFQAWYVNTEVGAPGESSSTVSPRNTEIHWKEDLSGSQLITVGRPFSAVDGTTEVPLEAAAGKEGDVVRDESFSRGRLVVSFRDPAPVDPVAMRDYLVENGGVVDATDPVELLDAVAELMNFWTLTPAQHSAILQMLSTMPGVESYGNVEDRLGRAGFAFRLTSPEPDAHFYSLLVVDAETGRILSLETIYLGGIAELSIAPPAVIRYLAWRG